MRRRFAQLRLSTLLALANSTLAVLAILLISVVTLSLLWQLADAQARTTVRQSALNTRQAVARLADTIATEAEVLADRPTLHRLTASDDTAALRLFLLDFQQTSKLTGAAVVRDGALVAEGGDAGLQPCAGASPAIRAATPPLLVAYAPVQPVPGACVVVTRELDAALLGELYDQATLQVAVLPRAQLTDEEASLPTSAADASRIGTPPRYTALIDLPEADPVPLVLRVSSSTATVDQTIATMLTTLALVGGAAAALTGMISIGIGRRLSAPLRRLSAASRQIGRGDLTTHVRPEPGYEAGSLADTLDDMRQKLLQLTADLRRQQAEADAIITSVREGIFVVDADRRLTYLNPQAAAMLGTTPPAAIGQFCGDVFYPGSAERPCASSCPIVQARTRPGAQLLEHLPRPGGQRRTVVVVSSPSGEHQQVQVIRDETEQEAARRARDAILANISHEFRTPLSAQLASIELLLEQLPDLDTDDIARLAQSLQRGTLRLVRLVDNLLESVRIDAGQDSIRHGWVALDAVVEDAVEFIVPLLGQREQEVRIDLPYPLPRITGDDIRLTQVLVNLLANANKYAPARSIIQIGGAVQPDTVQLWVENSGTSLPPTDALFGRFVRAEADEPPQAGMGLGLWIAQSIVARHHGSITAERTDSGARFTISLPYTTEHP